MMTDQPTLKEELVVQVQQKLGEILALSSLSEAPADKTSEQSLEAKEALMIDFLKTVNLGLPKGFELNYDPERRIVRFQKENSQDLLHLTANTVLSAQEILRAKENPSKQTLPIKFYVHADAIPSEKNSFCTFEEALQAFKEVGPDEEKALSFIRFDEKGRGHGALLLRYDEERHETRVCGIGASALKDPHISLAYAKATLHCFPNDAAAWARRDVAEEALGIKDRIVDHSNDLLIGKWRIHVIPVGGHFGTHNQLVNHDRPMVEFLDTTYSNPWDWPHGQPAGQYDVDTILGNTPWSGDANYPNGFCLDASIPAWRLSAAEMKEVIAYLKTFDFASGKQPSIDSQIVQAQERKGLSPKGEKEPPSPER